jgi:hypothetical protein
VTQDKPFTIAPPDPLKLDVSSLPSFRQEPQRTAGGDVIRREVTVFNTVDHGAGRVETGWRYKDGSSREPTHQWCTYRALSADGLGTMNFSLADDGVPDSTIAPSVPDVKGALAKCQWWRGG